MLIQSSRTSKFSITGITESPSVQNPLATFQLCIQGFCGAGQAPLRQNVSKMAIPINIMTKMNLDTSQPSNNYSLFRILSKFQMT